MNIPNTITILRMLMAPVLAWLLLEGENRAALWVLFGAGISDVLDGAIARRFDLFTDLGAFLDPLADKALIIVTVVALALRGLFPWWLVVAIALRDLIIIGGAIAYYLHAGRLEMAPSIPSKVNTFVQICLILTILVTDTGLMPLSKLLPVVLGLTAVTTIFSGVHYIVVWGLKARGVAGS